MSKDPAFLFYPNDWLGGTLGMTFEEKGAYMELLMLQFNRGHMTSHMIGQTVGQLFGQIQSKFKIDADGLYYNERLEQEIEKRKAYCSSRKNNIEGKNQYTKTSGHMTSHTGGHMENENINENINLNKGSKRGMGREKGALDQAIDNFKEHRKKLRKPMTDHAVDLLFKKLDELANTDEQKIALIENAIEKGWQGVYPMDKAAPQSKPVRQRESFERPTQNYDHLAIDPFAEEGKKR